MKKSKSEKNRSECVITGCLFIANETDLKKTISDQ
jgi:hypothetical protein